MGDKGQPLAGRVIGVTAERRAEEQCELLRTRGAEVVLGPTIRTVGVEAAAELRDATEAVLAGQPDFVVAITGVGIRRWLAAADDWDRRDALVDRLKGARVMARGAKAASALRQAGVQEEWRAPNETVPEITAHLLEIGVDGATVAVQRHGGDMNRMIAALRDAGAAVIDVELYRWLLPDDVAPALDIVTGAADHRLDAVTFTSAPGVTNLFTIADQAGRAGDLLAAFNDGVVLCCVGPVCAEAATDEGVTDPLIPPRSRMVPMVDALAVRLQGR
ncbi:MAG: uroporphyrinogen-III synthase [Acidimicrobiales bacterium]|nr:uroporphyrinogen-III synthase [Acidimicrobiales bacterium]